MSNNTLYYKTESGRYKVAGTTYDQDYLSDGIWYVRSKGHHVTSVPYLAELFHVDVTPVDINLLCGMDDAKEYILNSKEFRDLTDGPCSLNDIVAICVKKIAEKNGQITSKPTF